MKIRILFVVCLRIGFFFERNSNNRFVLAGYQIPPMASKVNTSQPWMSTNISSK
jgi:hypothetical protein